MGAARLPPGADRSPRRLVLACALIEIVNQAPFGDGEFTRLAMAAW